MTKSTEISTRIPAGRSALAIKRYAPPVPAFGPGSPGYISESMKRLGLGVDGGYGHSGGVGETSRSLQAGDALPPSAEGGSAVDLDETIGVISPRPNDQERGYAQSMPGYY